MNKWLKLTLFLVLLLSIVGIFSWMRVASQPSLDLRKDIASPEISRDLPEREKVKDHVLSPPLIPLPQQEELWQ